MGSVAAVSVATCFTSLCHAKLRRPTKDNGDDFVKSFADVMRCIAVDIFAASVICCRHDDIAGSQCVSNNRQRKLAADVGCCSATWYDLSAVLQ